MTTTQISYDPLSPEERSHRMSLIQSKETIPEKSVRSLLHKNGYRFRKNVKELPGRPDIVLPRYHTVIFVHGCFWHRHHCSMGQKIPKNNRKYWRQKFDDNMKRDGENKKRLENDGWRVIVVWECQVKNEGQLINHLNEELVDSSNQH